MPGPAFLSADRIELRTAEREDVEFLQEAVSDPRVWRAVGRDVPYNLEQEGQFFQNVFCDQGTVHLLVTVEEEPIGVVAFEGVDESTGVAELNYWIVPDRWGEGYATEAVERFLDYGFDQRGFRKVVARVTAFNEASMGLLEKLGFVEEGVQREQEFVDGEYQDRHWYGLLEREWRDGDDR